MSDPDYGPKTGASSDRPYADEGAPSRRPPSPSAGKSPSTPPDAHTEIDTEADLDDPLAD